jgi:hypothetical protein
MIGLLSIVILFHSLIMLRIIPYEIVWAGKLKSIEEMLVFETISILVNILMIFTFAIKANYMKGRMPMRFINGVIWFFVAVFALNTIGNLFSENWIELVFGTSLTLISALLCWRIVYPEKL